MHVPLLQVLHVPLYTGAMVIVANQESRVNYGIDRVHGTVC